MITLVLASSRDRFNDWCWREGVNPRDKSLRFVRSVQNLRGLGQRVKLVVDESFHLEDGRSQTRRLLLEDALAVEARNNAYYTE